MKLKLLQRDVAERIGVDKTTVHNWESNTKTPRVEHTPAIIEFLGYVPLPPGKNWAERPARGRTVLGLAEHVRREARRGPQHVGRGGNAERGSQQVYSLSVRNS